MGLVLKNEVDSGYFCQKVCVWSLVLLMRSIWIMEGLEQMIFFRLSVQTESCSFDVGYL